MNDTRITKGDYVMIIETSEAVHTGGPYLVLEGDELYPNRPYITIVYPGRGTESVRRSKVRLATDADETEDIGQRNYEMSHNITDLNVDMK